MDVEMSRRSTEIKPSLRSVSGGTTLPSSHDFSFASVSPSSSPRGSAPMQAMLPSLAAEMQQAGRTWGSPSRVFASRELDSPVNPVFSRLNHDTESEGGAVASGGAGSGGGGGGEGGGGGGGGARGDKGQGGAISKDHSVMENSDHVTSTTEDDEEGNLVEMSPFHRPLSVANVAADRMTMDVHSEFLAANNFHQLHHFWIRSGNLRGNLVDSVPQSVLRAIMIGMIARRPSLLLVAEKMGTREAGDSVAKIMAMLLREVDIVAVPLQEDSTVASVVASIWRHGKTVIKHDTLFVFSSGVQLRRNVEQALVDLERNSKVVVGGVTYTVQGRVWTVLVASSLEAGFSSWLKRECVVSSTLTFGKPVGGLNPEVDSEWLEKHHILSRAAFQDADFARWTRDLVSLLRVSPYLQPNLVPGLADLVQLCAKCCALTAGRPFVWPVDYRGSYQDALRHHLTAKPGSPHSAHDILEACIQQLTFPT